MSIGTVRYLELVWFGKGERSEAEGGVGIARGWTAGRAEVMYIQKLSHFKIVPKLRRYQGTYCRNRYRHRTHQMKEKCFSRFGHSTKFIGELIC